MSGVETRGHICIDKGEDFSNVFKFRKNGGVDLVDLSTASEIMLSFKKDDGTFHVATLSAYDSEEAPDSNSQVSLVEGTSGDVALTLPADVTASLKAGEAQTVGVAWIIGETKTKMFLDKVLDVREAFGV